MTKDQYFELCPAAEIIYEEAMRMELFQLVENFNDLEYDSFGFGGLLIFKRQDEEYWDSGLRNEHDSTVPDKPDFKAKNLKESLALLFAYCCVKRYFKQ
jgi:hypothetical protein